jgi:hypothetical protein
MNEWKKISNRGAGTKEHTTGLKKYTAGILNIAQRSIFDTKYVSGFVNGFQLIISVQQNLLNNVQCLR